MNEMRTNNSPAKLARAVPIQRNFTSRVLIPTAILSFTTVAGLFAQTQPVVPETKNSLGIPFAELAPGIKIASWEVRVSDFAAYLNSAKAPRPPAPPFPQDENHPVVNVTRSEAAAFCDWLTTKERAEGRISPDESYRLPSCEEWAFAAGSGPIAGLERVEQQMLSASSFPWGGQWPPPAGAGNFSDRDIPGYVDGFDHTSPVGSFTPTKSGIHDLAGNVWEWTSDTSGANGVLRGGSWMYFAAETLRTAYRYEVPPEMRSPTFGFRLLLATSRASLAAVQPAGSTPGPLPQQPEAKPMSEEELAQARERFLGGSPSGATAEVQQPAAGKPFTNSINMKFRPLPGSQNLAAETETTKGQFFAIKPADFPSPPAPAFAQEDSHPIVMVSFADAEAFCGWLTQKEIAEKRIPLNARYRLPTDAEWSALTGVTEAADSPSPSELAAKVDPTVFPWGTEWPPPQLSGNFGAVENVATDRHPNTAPVASYRPNDLVFSDLEGNVSEWTSTPWTAGAANLTIRGANWTSGTKAAISLGSRQNLPPDTRSEQVGFRCILELPASAK